ncbi:MAG TPA: sulfate adenylyltransferase, partial [Rudaea sp.]|nr:sulfate adenylyltransferase [Rudaea sp.]
MSQLIAPHGGQLVNLQIVPAAERIALKREAAQLPAWDLTPRQICDLEMLLSGAFSPLTGFMTRADYEPVCRDMRLASGVPWPVPITLDVTREFADKLGTAKRIALRDPEGVTLAVLDIEDRWEADREREAREVFGTADALHAGVNYLLNKANPIYLGGRVAGIEAPRHYDFRHLRLTPRDLREHFEKLGWHRVVAFQTRNPMHRAHLELTFRAAQIAEANLLIHPSVGMTKPGDIDHYTRVRCYEKLIAHYPEQTTMLSLLPLAMRMGGPREAVWHAII